MSLEQKIVGIVRFDAQAVAGIEEKNDVAFLHRGEERLESLVEIALAAQFVRQRDVLLVEAHLLEVGCEIARVIVGSRQARDILVGVALLADEKSAPRLRARRSTPRQPSAASATAKTTARANPLSTNARFSMRRLVTLCVSLRVFRFRSGAQVPRDAEPDPL